MAALSVLLCLSLFICSIAHASGVTDIKGNWAASEIEKALSTGYVKGYPDGSFRPNGGVTRAEFVTMVDSAFQVAPGQGKTSFKDVHSKDWFVKDIQSAVAAGFVNGYPDGTFRPQQTIDRQEAAGMMAKLLNLSGKEGNSNTLGIFSDGSQIDTWARPSVTGLIASGIMSGYPDQTFRPQNIISRAEAVVLINKALAFQFTPVSTQLQVEGDYVNVRSGPGMNNPVIGQAHQGDTLQAMAKSSDDWYQIDYQGGTGWVAGWVVQVYQAAKPLTPTSPATGTTTPTSPATGTTTPTSPATGTTTPTSPATGTTTPTSPATGTTTPTSPATGTTTPTSPATGTTTPTSPATGTTTPTSPATGTNANPGTLNVQVEQSNTGTTVDITGAQGNYQYQEETNPQSLLVTIPGITAVQSPSEIDVGTGGLDKITTSFPVATPGTTTSGTTSGTEPVTTTGTNASVATPGTAQVLISFTAAQAPLLYSIKQGAPGELLITLAPQIYQVQATPISDFVAVSISGTVPLSIQPSTAASSSTQLVFDIAGPALTSSLQSWKQQVNTMGVDSVQISQYQPNLARLVVQVNPDVSYMSGTSADGTQVSLWLQEPAAKKALLANPTSGSVYCGIDLCAYPGDQVMQAWWNDSPFCYTGFYLGPTAYHSDTSFMNKRQVLINQGWGLLPIYVGRQADSEHLDTPTGIADADEAVSLVTDNAFPRNTTIYLDIETGLPLTVNYINYVTSWAREIQGKGYAVGIYCNTKNADQVRSVLPGAAFWVAHYAGYGLPSSALNLANTGVSYAGSWQFASDSSLTYGGYPLTVDIDVSNYHDPSTAPGSSLPGNISMW